MLCYVIIEMNRIFERILKTLALANEIYMEKANVIITSFRILAIDQYVSFFLNERTYKGRIGRFALQEQDKNWGLA